MAKLQASRTLVKSPPELWAQCSDAASLARHLRPFGVIRITKLEPETAIAWEGDDVSGTVRLEPSGWGTRVLLTASQAGPPEAPAQRTRVTEAPAPEREPRAGRLARVLARLWRRPPPPEAEDGPVAEPAAAPRTEREEPPSPAAAALGAALDSLGMAHHRPYSRA